MKTPSLHTYIHTYNPSLLRTNPSLSKQSQKLTSPDPAVMTRTIPDTSETQSVSMTSNTTHLQPPPPSSRFYHLIPSLPSLAGQSLLTKLTSHPSKSGPRTELRLVTSPPSIYQLNTPTFSPHLCSQLLLLFRGRGRDCGAVLWWCWGGWVEVVVKIGLGC